jgi:cytochrome c553
MRRGIKVYRILPSTLGRASVWIVMSSGLLGISSATTGAETVQFNRDVRPILSQNCFRCHGPDSASRKAELRLDRREDAETSGAIVAGDPDASELVRRIFADDAAELMPPPETHLELTAEQKDLLKRWVAEGAKYEAHWSLIAPQRPALPAVRQSNWVRNPIDRFILAQLEANGLTPAPEADRRILARRLSLDLTGLPPSVESVERFVADTSVNAYEKLVEEYLGSPQWGEHRGRYWLDAARYADTHGIHFDNYREIWAYRDWVIGAFNRNLPFDQFTIEQLAGDLLPQPTLDQQIASGFNRCNITTNEGGVIPEEYLVLYTRDRTETTSAVWMGLTTGCAVCHDHKFDAITQREFYELAAFFNNSTQGAMDGNIKDTPPIVTVPQMSDRQRWEALPQELASAQAQVEQRKGEARPSFEKWLQAADSGAMLAMIPQQELLAHLTLHEGSGTSLRLTAAGTTRDVPADGIAWEPGYVADKACAPPAGAIVVPDVGAVEKDKAFSCGAWIKLGNPNQSGPIVARMDEGNGFRGWDLWLEGGRIGMHLVHQWPGDALKVIGKAKLEANRWYHVLATYDGSGKAAGAQIYVDGVSQGVDVASDNLQNTLATEVPLKIAQRHQGQPLAGLALQDLRFYGRVLDAAEAIRLKEGTRAAWLATKPAEQRTAEETNELFGWWLLHLDEPYQQSRARVANLEGEKQAIVGRGTIAHIMTEKKEEPMAFVLFRGEYDQRRDQVKADTPDLLPPLPGELPRNRLGFAQWLMRPDHPLTARVTANRFWQEVFGTGLVRTAGDFGVTGELPSHPELLDWLAVEFRESGWNVQQLFRLMVTSATYRQSAATTPEKVEKDPKNRLLSRGPRFRMDAEMVRDNALAVSGLLAPKIGGPSVRPYQPEGVWEAVAMIGSNTRDYRAEQGENLYRRSMYTFWKRSAPPASMDIFNAPSREICTVCRERTNTPLQALVTLNDPQFIEAARNLAQWALKGSDAATAARCDAISRRLLSRPLRTEEQQVVEASLTELLAHYQAHPDQAAALLKVGESVVDAGLEPATLAAWTMLCNQLMNLDEVLNK